MAEPTTAGTHVVTVTELTQSPSAPISPSAGPQMLQHISSMKKMKKKVAIKDEGAEATAGRPHKKSSTRKKVQKMLATHLKDVLMVTKGRSARRPPRQMNFDDDVKDFCLKLFAEASKTSSTTMDMEAEDDLMSEIDEEEVDEKQMNFVGQRKSLGAEEKNQQFEDSYQIYEHWTKTLNDAQFQQKVFDCYKFMITYKRSLQGLFLLRQYGFTIEPNKSAVCIIDAISSLD
jgi:hypothetical protein